MALEGSRDGGGRFERRAIRRSARRFRWWVSVAAAGFAVAALTGCPSSTGTDTPPAGTEPVPVEVPSAGSSTPSTGGGSGTALDADGAAYVGAIASLDATGLDEEQGGCLAVEWVRAIGVPAFRSAGITPDQLRSEERSLADVPIDATVAGAMVDGFDRCGIDTEALIVDEAAGRQIRNEAVADCVAGRLTPQGAREAWIATLTGGEPSALEAIVEACAPTGPPRVTGLIAPDE